MRILFLTHAYPPHELGGWPQNCAEVVESLQTRGHVAHVLTSRYGVTQHSHAESEVVRKVHFQAGLEHYRLADWLLRSIRDRGNALVLKNTIHGFQPDVVFIWGIWNLSRTLPSLAERWVSPLRVAYAIADYWPIEPDMHGYYWNLPAGRAVTERAKGLIRPSILRALSSERARYPIELRNVACVSEYVRAKLQDASALPHGACVIYNGIDAEQFVAVERGSRDLRECRLLYFGSLAERKGVHTTIEALGLLRQRGMADGCTLTIVGSGHPDYVDRLGALVQRLELQDCVFFLGQLPRGEIPALLARHDVFLFSSIYEEPIARTVMEAMASGLVVIGTAVGGQREMLVDCENALVFAPGDAAGLADRIVELRRSPELYDRLARAGRETVLQRFTLDRMVDEMEAWLQSIVDEAGPA